MGKIFISQNTLRSTKELCTVHITVVLEKENSYMLKMNTLDKNDNILPITGEVSLSCVVRGYLLGTTDYVDVDVVNLLISSGGLTCWNWFNESNGKSYASLKYF